MGITVKLAKQLPLAKTTRGSLPFGVVFSHVDNTGSPKTTRFANLGKGTKLFSVNLTNGELSSSPVSKEDTEVIVTGQFDVVATIARDYATTTRGALAVGDVFSAKAMGSEYVHMGTLSDGRFLALNLDSQDYAIAPADKGSKSVVKIGTSRIEWSAVI